MSVDLPAPFSPTTAWISPALRSKSTSVRACTPGKAFEMPRMESSGALSDTVNYPERSRAVRVTGDGREAASRVELGRLAG